MGLRAYFAVWAIVMAGSFTCGSVVANEVRADTRTPDWVKVHLWEGPGVRCVVAVADGRMANTAALDCDWED